MKVKLPQLSSSDNNMIKHLPAILQKLKTIPLTVVLLASFFTIASKNVNGQIIFKETFNNLTAVNYGVSIQPSTFDAVFDNTGWTSTSSSGQSIAEAGALCIGKSGSSGGTLTTRQMDLSGSDPITLTFKLKFYGTNSITGSTSSKVSVKLDAATIFSGVKGVVSVPTGSPNYNATSYTTYTITLTGGTAASTISFVGTSSNYAFLIDDVVVERIPTTPPTLTTNSATNVAYTTTTVGGTITSSNISSITERGIVYSTSPNPQIGGVGTTQVAENPLTATAGYSIDLSGLSPGQTYYYNAYAINNYNGSTTVYGGEMSFTTKALTQPTIVTTAATNITSFGALTGGNITDDGGTAVTARGVVWSTSHNPTIPSANSTSDGIGTGIFNSQITGLTASTTYYIRAYATNTNGTSYGNEITVTTDAPQPSLVASVSALNFPSSAIGSPVSLTYTLTGTTLDGSPVTITAPAGFTVNPSSITYTGNSFTQVVTVTFTPSVVGSTSGSITQTGGGAAGLYIINPSVSGFGTLPIPAVTSNVGNDFWLGFGYHAQMKDVSSGSTKADLSVYVSNPSATTSTVVVEMPDLNGGFVTQTQDIAPGGFYEFSGFPRGDGTAANATNAPDSRLYYTGVSNRGIHIYSSNGVPVSVWLYDYTYNDAAGGSLVFPTNTWNTSYIVQTIGGGSNSAGSQNSFFFVVAEEDGTEIEITPSGDILDSVAISTIETSNNVKYSPTTGSFLVTLNRGQIFNALSPIYGGFGVDLSGSIVRSTNCKKIAVFAGNGRNGIGSDLCNYTNGSGSDNLIQQMFPKVAWGTKYYTTPIKHMAYNPYRITVDDPATTVWVNDPTHTTPLTGYNSVNKFYEIFTNKPTLIESDKPISVTQFISSESCASNELIGNNGKGDPEMIILSPSAQAINKVTVFSPTVKNGNLGGSYINVVIPKAGIKAFKLDYDLNPSQMVDTGSSSYILGVAFNPADALIPIDSAFQPYTADSSYYWATFKVDAGASHSLESSVPFNAIAYGTAQGESYGFNAGTQVNNLTAPLIIENPYGGPSQNLSTCRGTDFKVSAVLPYETNKITFSFPANTPVVPASDTTLEVSTGFLPHDSTYVVNGQTFYVYNLKRTYTFSASGSYAVNVISFDNNTTDVCAQGKDKTISYNIDVVTGLNAQFGIAYNKCLSDSVILTDSSDGVGHTINKWKWTYDNGSKSLSTPNDTLQNPRIKNPADNAAANYTLLAVNDIGCFNTITKALPDNPLPPVVFSPLSPNPVCSNGSVITLNATPAGGVFSGTGVTGNQFTPSVAGAGSYTLKYVYSTGPACKDSATQSIVVNPSAALSITPVNPLCVTAEAVTLEGTPAGGVFTGTGVSNGKFDPQIAGVGPHTITYTNGTCSAPKTLDIIVSDKPVANAGPNDTIPLRSPTPLKATATAGATYLWTPAQWLSDATQLTPTITPEQLGDFPYKLTVSQGGCTVTDDVIITVKGRCVYPPMAFTPNGDGFNDKWIISDGTCAKQIKLDVYNRWGGLVYSSDNYKNDWDGTRSGTVIPDGTYYYVIKATLVGGDAVYYKGNVTIMR